MSWMSSTNVEGVTFSAGLTTGDVFSGLVGNPASRCKYAMMGGTFPERSSVVGREGGEGGFFWPELPCTSSATPAPATTIADTIIDNNAICVRHHAVLQIW